MYTHDIHSFIWHSPTESTVQTSICREMHVYTEASRGDNHSSDAPLLPLQDTAHANTVTYKHITHLHTQQHNCINHGITIHAHTSSSHWSLQLIILCWTLCCYKYVQRRTESSAEFLRDETDNDRCYNNNEAHSKPSWYSYKIYSSRQSFWQAFISSQ